MNDVDVLVGDLAGLKTEQQKLFRAQSCVAVVPRASLGEGSSSVCVRVYIFQDLHICVWSCTVFHICAGKGSDGGVRQRPRHTCQMDAGTLMHVHAHTHETHTHTNTRTHTHTHTYIDTHTRTRTRTHTHTYTYSKPMSNSKLSCNTLYCAPEASIKVSTPAPRHQPWF